MLPVVVADPACGAVMLMRLSVMPPTIHLSVTVVMVMVSTIMRWLGRTPPPGPRTGRLTGCCTSLEVRRPLFGSLAPYANFSDSVGGWRDDLVTFDRECYTGSGEKIVWYIHEEEVRRAKPPVTEDGYDGRVFYHPYPNNSLVGLVDWLVG